MINSSDEKSAYSYKNEKQAFSSIPRHKNIVYCPAMKDSYEFKGLRYSCIALENCPKGSIIGMLVDKQMTFQES